MILGRQIQRRRAHVEGSGRGVYRPNHASGLYFPGAPHSLFTPVPLWTSCCISPPQGLGVGYLLRSPSLPGPVIIGTICSPHSSHRRGKLLAEEQNTTPHVEFLVEFLSPAQRPLYRIVKKEILVSQ